MSHPADTTGHFHTSWTLTEIIRGLALRDAWNQNTACPAYTCYSSNRATRLDCFYMSNDLLQQKTGIEIIPVVFTDHHAVALRVQINELKRGRDGWKLNPKMMANENLQ